MINLDKNLCIKCGKCLIVCPFTVLSEDEQKYPFMPEKKEKFCIHCMHCVAICPKVALSFPGVPVCEQRSVLPTTTSYDSLKTIVTSNRSVRNFTDKSVPLSEIEEIIRLTDYAPSSKNQHPTQWILVHDPQKSKEVFSAILEYVKETGTSREILFENEIGNNVVTFDAPHLLYGIAPLEGAVNPYTDTIIKLTDIDLLLHSKDISSCWAGYLSRLSNASEKIRKMIGLEDNMQSFAALAFGYAKGERYDKLPFRNESKIHVV